MLDKNLTEIIFERLSAYATDRKYRNIIFYTYNDINFDIGELMFEVDNETEIGKSYIESVIDSGIKNLLIR